MPDSPHARSETRANAPKPSQQSKANRSNGTKTRHMHFSPGIRWGERLLTLLGEGRANPVGRGVKTPTNAQLPMGSSGGSLPRRESSGCNSQKGEPLKLLSLAA